MTADWIALCRAKDLSVDGEYITVQFAQGRQHTLSIEEGNEAYLLKAIIVKQSVVSSINDLPIQVWLRNRAATLVGFRIDHRGRLVGEAFVPKTGIEPDEFQFYVRTLAIEADRFEYSLTGKDLE
jgi:hypothetical protein